MIIIRLIYGIILGQILIAIFIIFYKKEKNLFSPICFFCLLQFLYYVPNIINKDVENYTLLTNENTLTVFLYEVIYIFFVVLGYLMKSKKINENITIVHLDNEVPKKNYDAIILITFLIGLSAKIFVVQKLGGIQFVFNNMSLAYSAQSSGYGLINYIAKFMLIGILLMFKKMIGNKKFINKIILLLMVLIYMASYFIYSSRGPALELILLLAFCSNFLMKKNKLKDIIKPKYLIIVICTALIAVILVNFRSNSSGQTLNMDITSNLSNTTSAFIDEFSKVGRDAFTYDYFNSENFWNGKAYMNILTGFIPSKIYPNKPPVDEGLYLLHLMLGIPIDPNSGRLDLYYKAGSVPFTSQGLMYANFGILGIAIGAALIGILYSKSYDILKKRCNVFTVANYFYFLYMFEFTPLHIMNTIQYILIFLVFDKLLMLLENSKLTK